MRQASELTERLAIEPLVPAHALELHAALDDPSVGRFIGGPDVTTVEALQARIERLAIGPSRLDERWLNFAVRLRAESTVIGRLEATVYGRWAEIAYVFGPRWWGCGYATEATSWLIWHLAGQGISELWAAIHPANTASRRLLIRAGFLAVALPWRTLASFDPGDDAFVR